MLRPWCLRRGKEGSEGRGHLAQLPTLCSAPEAGKQMRLGWSLLGGGVRKPSILGHLVKPEVEDMLVGNDGCLKQLL